MGLFSIHFAIIAVSPDFSEKLQHYLECVLVPLRQQFFLDVSTIHKTNENEDSGAQLS